MAVYNVVGLKSWMWCLIVLTDLSVLLLPPFPFYKQNTSKSLSTPFVKGITTIVKRIPFYPQYWSNLNPLMKTVVLARMRAYQLRDIWCFSAKKKRTQLFKNFNRLNQLFRFVTFPKISPSNLPCVRTRTIWYQETLSSVFRKKKKLAILSWMKCELVTWITGGVRRSIFEFYLPYINSLAHWNLCAQLEFKFIKFVYKFCIIAASL